LLNLKAYPNERETMTLRKKEEADKDSNNFTKFLYTEKEAGAYLTIPVKTLQVYRLNGSGPLFVKIGKNVRYKQEHLDEYIESHTFKSTTEYKARKKELMNQY